MNENDFIFFGAYAQERFGMKYGFKIMKVDKSPWLLNVTQEPQCIGEESTIVAASMPIEKDYVTLEKFRLTNGKCIRMGYSEKANTLLIQKHETRYERC